MNQRTATLRPFASANALVVAFLLAAALGAGAFAGALNGSTMVAAVVAAVAGVIAIAVNPVLGAWAWLLFGPLIVGFARGGTLPLVRPNEALLLVAAAGVALNAAWRFSKGERILPALGKVDAAMALLLVTGSILPLLVRYGRGLPISADDLLYSLVFAKYFVLFALFRMAVQTPDQVATCLRLILISGAIVGIVGILQVQGLFNVANLLHTYYDAPFEATQGPINLRGTSTVASAFGLGDIMAMCLAIIIAWLPAQRGVYRVLAFAAGALFFAGSIAAGSFSGIIGCAVVVLAVGLVARRLAPLIAVLIPTTAIAALLFWPVVAARLAGFESRQALPKSWLGRWENLERFFWPEVFSGFNWLLGVRPAGRVGAPEAWRTWVYIESGHTWLLWTGGLPLLLAFLWFSWVAGRMLFRIARSEAGPVGVAATAAFGATAMIFVLMLFDPHLTVRGTADMFFPLLALAISASGIGSAERALPTRLLRSRR